MLLKDNLCLMDKTKFQNHHYVNWQFWPQWSSYGFKHFWIVTSVLCYFGFTNHKTTNQTKLVPVILFKAYSRKLWFDFINIMDFHPHFKKYDFRILITQCFLIMSFEFGIHYCWPKKLSDFVYLTWNCFTLNYSSI